MRNSTRSALALGLLGVAAVAACKNVEGFVQPAKHTETIVDLRNAPIAGQGQIIYPVAVQDESQMGHPHFEGRWTFADGEKPIDVYVFPAAHYLDTAPPAAQDSILFWSSLQNAVVGQQRETSMHLHPAPGNWVLVFYNSAAATPTGRTTFSATISLTYFK